MVIIATSIAEARLGTASKTLITSITTTTAVMFYNNNSCSIYIKTKSIVLTSEATATAILTLAPKTIARS